MNKKELNVTDCKFKVGDEVVRSICGSIGTVKRISSMYINVTYPGMEGSYHLDGTAGGIYIRKATKLEKALK